jgi:ferrous iron transport protein B
MILVYVPCIATIGVIQRETNWRWALLTIGYTFVLAWILSTAFYQIGSLFA